MKRIIITGGHLTPALAVIKELQKEGDWEILFLGRLRTMEGDKASSAESKIIPQLGVKFVGLKAGRLQRRLTRYTGRSLLKIPLGFFQAFSSVKKFRPQVILSFGGYLAAPVALAGWLLGVPILTHEQSVTPGLATRLIAFLAQKVAVSWPETEKYFPQKKVIYTGNPLRKEILKIPHHPPSTIHHPPSVYITGGNQGAHVINEVVGQSLAALLKKYRVIHQCGTVEYYGDYEKLETRNSKLETGLRKRYRLAKWFGSKEVAEILKKADLVISRAGANIITELAYLAQPAILIPLPSGREQRRNAQKLAQTGLAVILPQEKLTPQSLSETIDSTIKNLEKLKKQAKKARQLVQPRATENLVLAVKKIIRKDEKK